MRCIQQYSLLIFVVPSQYLLWQVGFLPNPASSRDSTGELKKCSSRHFISGFQTVDLL